jgi:hypothetical protein
MENEKVCCPPFDPTLWEDKTTTWDNKLFIKDSVKTFFHMPLPGSMGKMMERLWEKAKLAQASPETKDFIMLADNVSSFKCNYYMAVTKEVLGTENIKLSGTFITKVFDGPYKDVPKWFGEMDFFIKAKGETAKKYYLYYTTCPKCAKKYGHNYVVIFAQIK